VRVVSDEKKGEAQMANDGVFELGQSNRRKGGKGFKVLLHTLGLTTGDHVEGGVAVVIKASEIHMATCSAVVKRPVELSNSDKTAPESGKVSFKGKNDIAAYFELGPDDEGVAYGPARIIVLSECSQVSVLRVDLWRFQPMSDLKKGPRGRQATAPYARIAWR
jgi:hypothetical protein